MNNDIFFSVCIPATNRSSTIFRTLSSVANQTFRSFEVIISIRVCEDNTVEVVNGFFESKTFGENQFKYKLLIIDSSIEAANDWNDPLLHASGMYIAVLEGDDEFVTNRLEKAHKYLSVNSDCGICVTGNQDGLKKQLGKFEGKKYSKLIYGMKEVPPPSETIFKRVDRNFKSYLYNTNDYIYAPEIDLYLRISLDGFHAYHDNEKGIVRDRTTTFLKGVGWKYFQDHFFILEKYKYHFDYITRKKAALRLEWRLIKAFIKEASAKTELFGKISFFRMAMPSLVDRRPLQEKCPACGGNLFLKYDLQSDKNFRMTTDLFYWVECESCKSLKIGPNDKIGNLARYYEHYIPHQAKMREYRRKEMPFAYIKQKIKNKFNNLEDIRIIDLGCGSGTTLHNLRVAFPKSILYGLDVNTTYATQQLVNSNIRLVSGMLDCVELDGKFDVIISSQFLEHLNNPRDYIKFIENFANKGALIIFDIPNIESKTSRLFKDNWIHLDTPRHQFLPTKKGLKLLFKAFGELEFYRFGSYMAYVSSIKITLSLNLYSSRVLNRIFTRIVQIACIIIPSAWMDDKILISASFDGKK
jgi:glycosyltransferase involved in cell wall biosynthesis/SAM-dependent methyltransferase